MADAITARQKDFSKWYLDIVREAKLADYAPVRGCMIIRPNGYAIWENMQSVLDGKFKATGHRNAYFPLFIPESFLAKEADHVEGFAKECAVVTHSKLGVDADGVLTIAPESKLEENLVVRPTSETIIWDAYSKWIQSWRDLPILINQWSNVVRWEMRTRLFLRTLEFLWQEGHTAHATKEEAVEETRMILDIYADFAENYMAIPVIRGIKSESERFAGAVETYCIEALMQDGKALQAGTSHFLGQNFAKAFDCKFQNKDNQLEYVWATSWGVSTRLIGALIMAHSDDQGLILPPKLAPTQVVIVPIYRKDEERTRVLRYGEKIRQELSDSGISVLLDSREQLRPGFKFNQYETEGVPVRIAIGPRDLDNGVAEIARRDRKDKQSVAVEGIVDHVSHLLDDIQKSLFNRAKEFQTAMTTRVDSMDEFEQVVEEKGGYLLAHWDGSAETEAEIKQRTKATIRCIPLDQELEDGVDMISGKPSQGRVVFAKAY